MPVETQNGETVPQESAPVEALAPTMTAAEISQLERDIQLGRVKTLPDGRSVEDVRRENAERDRLTQAEASASVREQMVSQSSATVTEPLQVSVTETGQIVGTAISAAPPVADSAPTGGADQGGETIEGRVETVERIAAGEQISWSVPGEQLPPAATAVEGSAGMVAADQAEGRARKVSK